MPTFQLAVPCPYCHERPISCYKPCWFIYGFLFFAQYGSRRLLGCEHCVHGKLASTTLTVLLAGWWCFPWGPIGTPLCLIHNLVVLFSESRLGVKELREDMQKAGVHLDDVLLDKRGRVRGQQDRLEQVYTVLADAMYADGKVLRSELDCARGILEGVTTAFLPVSDKELLDQIRSRRRRTIECRGAELDWRIMLLRCAADVVEADGEIAEQEVEYIVGLADRLAIPHHIVEAILSRFYGHSSGEPRHAKEREYDRELETARQVLGVTETVSLAQLKTRYRQLCLEHHPDRHVGERDKKMAEAEFKKVSAAYQLLLTGLHEAVPASWDINWRPVTWQSTPHVG